MGEKLRVKSKNKAPKASKGGLRPHEARAQAEGTKTVPGQTAPPGTRKRD